MNWFEKRMNTTVLLSWLASYLLFLILIAFGAFVLDPYISPGGLAENVLMWVFLLILVTSPVPVEWWFLKGKSRSPWWLLVLYLVPFGVIIFFNLKDRSEQASQRRYW